MTLLPRLGNPLRLLRQSSTQRQVRRILMRHGAADVIPDHEAGSSKVMRIVESRPDLREAFPLGLTPAQRDGFAAWLFANGRADLGLTDEEIAGYLFHAAADRSHGLRVTWLLTPAFQERVPDPFSPSGWRAFQSFIADHFKINARWLHSAKRPRETPAKSWGVNTLAHFRHPSGLQEEAWQIAAAIRAHGGGVSLRDAPLGMPTPHDWGEDLLGPERYGITLAPIGACESFDAQYSLVGWHPRPGVHRIACMAWELETLPPKLVGKADLADEIWALSEFSAKALRKAFPNKVVTAMLPGVSLPKFEPMPRAQFQLPADRFLFLFAFDMASVMERKNPLGLIAAFQRTFRPEDRVHLAIKVSRGESRPTDFARLKQAAAAAGVSIIDRILPRNELAALMNCCDAYVSPHRAEGFGYTIAEAMLLGKPTIATAYSSNLEFMTPSTAYAVDCRLVPVGPGNEPYPADAIWAEPCVEHAASLMRFVFEHQDEARAVGVRAKESIIKLLSPQAAGTRMLARLDAIRVEKANFPRQAGG